MQNISLKNNTEQVDLVYLTHKLEAQFVSQNLINNTENLTIHFSINPTGKIISVKDFGGVIGNMMKTLPIDKPLTKGVEIN